MNRRPRKNTRRNARNTPRRRGRGIVRVIESRRNPSYPPQRNDRPIISRTLRYFVSGAVTAEDVTARCLLNLIVATNTATTTAVNVYEALKINRIAMYFAPSSVDGLGATSGEIILNWRGARSPDTRLSDRGTLGHPACVKSIPPFESLASFWITNQGDIDSVLFNLTCPLNTIIDLNLSMTIGDGTTRSITLSAVGSTTGIEYMALNNAVAAGTVGALTIIPDSLTTQNVTTP